MSHSYAANFVHCVFSTKDRRDLIPADLQERLYAYLSGTAKNLGIDLLATGGTSNHLHLLPVIQAPPPTLRLAEAVQKLKANSSRWLSENKIEFEWQKGYGAFSVSSSQLTIVQTYIRNQLQHHAKRNFDEEFQALLRKSGIIPIAA